MNPTPIVYALMLTVLHPPLQPVQGVQPRAAYELASFDTRTECEIHATWVRVDQKAARLNCIPRERAPDEIVAGRVKR